MMIERGEKGVQVWGPAGSVRSQRRRRGARRGRRCVCVCEWMCYGR